MPGLAKRRMEDGACFEQVVMHKGHSQHIFPSLMASGVSGNEPRGRHNNLLSEGSLMDGCAPAAHKANQSENVVYVG